ncbi:MAG: glutamate dehydrogenase (NADP+) [Chloroflexi bacterium]|nr:MAG: glutamate dehydrogenase (NADP+) [Chloroflexota bacterium]
MNDPANHAVERFMERVAARNPHEPEFLQAVREVAESVVPYELDQPRFAQARILERITEPDRILQFRVCWEDDTGAVQINRGARVQVNNAIGPYKGGLRFHPSVTLSILKFLGFEQTFKNSLTSLPMGGAKGGADFDPKGRSDHEIMRFCQAYMTELEHHIGSDTDVPAGDIGVGAREIGYLFGQFKRLRNEVTGAMTGKGIEYGGSLMRQEATGFGAVYFASEMLRQQNDDLNGKICAISGCGNVAQFAAAKALELGARVVTLSDSGGFIHDADGIDAEKLNWVMELKNARRGRIAEYADRFGVPYYQAKRPWGVPCDVALPCATQNEIEAANANTLVAGGVRLVAEGANMPTTPDAVALFQQAGVLYAPGKAANAGGVAVSGLEQSQNALRLQWTAEEVDGRLRDIMHQIHARCVEFGGDATQVDYVRGANIAGYLKVAEAMVAQGTM